MLQKFQGIRLQEFRGLFLLTLYLLIPLSLNPVLAQEPFYKGKTITIIQGTSPGGTADMMVRAALPYL